jgi:NAD(P)-dependent dehydrogenase (short-subunit alcohol dehydrogenase family)
MSQSWFVSGANRGIGFDLVKQIASRPNTIVFASARNPAKATTLQQFAKEHPNVHIVQLEATSEEDAMNAAKSVEHTSGKLDVLIANAGMYLNHQPAIEVDIKSFQQHLDVNLIGTLILFKALYPLLAKGSTKKVVTISSFVGSIASSLPVANTVYGSTKAALNYVTRSIHKEHLKEGFIVFPIDPGMVDTDMFQSAKEEFLQFGSPITSEESAKTMLEVINRAGPEDSGRFWSHGGTELSW